MGMFDSVYVKCPKCKKELEFQSKSGRCCLDRYTKSTLRPEVAYGINGDIVRCQFCDSRVRIICELPDKVKSELIIVSTKKFDYEGNYNPKRKFNIIKAVKLKRSFGINMKETKLAKSTEK